MPSGFAEPAWKHLSAVADAPKHTQACFKRQLDGDWTLFLADIANTEPQVKFPQAQFWVSLWSYEWFICLHSLLCSISSASVWACHQVDQHMINNLSLPQSCLPSSQLSRRHLPRLGKVAKKSNGGIQGRLSLKCCFNISKIVTAPPKTDREELLWIPKLPSIATTQVHLIPHQLLPRSQLNKEREARKQGRKRWF